MKKLFRKFTAVLLITTFLITSQVTTAFAAKAPSINGKAAIVYCATTGEVVYKKNADKEMNPASMTKLMTCLLAIENLDLDKKVTITKEATQVIPSMIYLQVGEKIKVKDLLYAALLESANDAAAALAIEVSGSTKSFAKLMNTRAEAIGCKHTNFVNPHGLYGKGHHSSARDIALITEEALKNKTLKKIATTLEYTIPKTNKYGERPMKNGNLFLAGGEREVPTGIVKVKKYKGVFGGKTGTSEEGVATMTVGLNYDDLELYAVIMGTTVQQRFSDIKKLLDYGKQNVSKYVVFEKDAEFEPGKVWGGATNRVTGIASVPGYINLPEGASASLVTTKAIYKEKLEAPIKKGQVVGTVEIYIADEKVREIEMVASEDVKEGWFLSKFRVTNFQTVIICAVFALIVICIIGIAVLRSINRKKAKKRRQQRIMAQAMRELEREKDTKQRNWPY